MWFLFKVAVVLAVILVSIFINSQDLCPSCGTELADRWDEPGSKADSCECGWRRDRG